MRLTTTAFFGILVLILMDLVEELVEAFFRLPSLDFFQALAVLLRDTNLHLGQSTLLPYVPREHFLLRIHVIVAVKVDGLRPRGSIAQVLLHPFHFELLALLLC